MFNKISYLVTILSMSLMLSSCGSVPITTTTFASDSKNGKDVKINLTSDNVPTGVIAVSVDDTKLTTKDYTTSDTELIIPKLSTGTHTIKISYKDYGSVDLPIEVRANADNTYQLKTTVQNNQIGDWQLGLGVTSDGVISDSQIYSKQVSNYVVVNDFSGTTNYLPKEQFAQDFRNHKFRPKPSDFKDFPPPPMSDNINNPVFFHHDDDRQNNFPPNNLSPDKLATLKVNVPIPSEYSKLKVFGIVTGDKFIDDSSYKFDSNSISIKGESLRAEHHKDSLMKVFLIDDTGQGILLNISSKAPIFNSFNVKDVISTNVTTDININADDLEYIVNKDLKLDLTKLQELKLKGISGVFGIDNPPPRREHNFPLRFNNSAQQNSSNNINIDSTKKYVTVDNNGEIVNYSDSPQTIANKTN